MYPQLFKLGPIDIHTFGVLIVIGFFFTLKYMTLQGRKLKIPDQKISDLAFYGLVIGFLGGRFAFVLTNWSHYQSKPLEILKFWEGGLVFYGGLITGIVSYIYLVKKFSLPLFKILDLTAPAIALGHIFGRIGCFAAGCCFGRECSVDFPLAVSFSHELSLAPKGVALHPAQLYDAFNAFIIFLILHFLYQRRKFDGQIFSFYLILYAVGRFIVETFRGDSDRGFVGPEDVLSTSQFIGIIMIIVGIGVYVVQSKKPLSSKKT